jgi:hypothetical protein
MPVIGLLAIALGVLPLWISAASSVGANATLLAAFGLASPVTQCFMPHHRRKGGDRRRSASHC